MKQHVYFVMAHPDDLNACLGLALKLKDSAKFQMHVIDFTRGERGLVSEGVSLEECARIRFEEETKVCSAIGVKQEYLCEVDGDAFATREACNMLAEKFIKEPPRVIITHWPVDCHPDHIMCGAVALKALKLAQAAVDPEVWASAAGETEVYFCNQHLQTISMPFTHYFPFDEETSQKKAALLRLYKCQNGDGMAEAAIICDRFNAFKSRCSAAAEVYGTYQRPLLHKKCFFDEV